MIKVNDKIADWLVINKASPYISPRGYRYPRWTCQCVCGKIKEVRESTLLDGDSKGCGCRRDKQTRDRMRTHSLSSHPLFSVWYGMQQRCNNSSRKDYKHYGGRGISVCEEWTGASGCANFISDMFSTYAPGLEIERMDVNGNYCPENCKWASRREQVINRRPTDSRFDTKFITYNGETLCLSQWAEKLNIDYRILIDRLGKLNWSVEKAFSTKHNVKAVFFEIQGKDLKSSDILKCPPNVFLLAKKVGLPFHQFMANVLGKKIQVKIQVAKSTLNVDATQDMSVYLTKIRFNEDLLKEYGVTI